MLLLFSCGYVMNKKKSKQEIWSKRKKEIVKKDRPRTLYGVHSIFLLCIFHMEYIGNNVFLRWNEKFVYILNVFFFVLLFFSLYLLWTANSLNDLKRTSLYCVLYCTCTQRYTIVSVQTYVFEYYNNKYRYVSMHTLICTSTYSNKFDGRVKDKSLCISFFLFYSNSNSVWFVLFI